MNPLIAQIQAGYEREVQQNRVPATAQELPLTFEAITDGWLTAVLCKDVPGAAVTAHRLSEPDNGTTSRRRIYVSYNSLGEQAGLPKAVFCKATLDLPSRFVLGLCGGARCEIDFYNEVRPLLDIEAPVPRHAYQDTESYNSMIMLDDLTDQAQAFCNHHTVMTRERAESQMRLLGKLHGEGYANEALRERLSHFPTFHEFFNKTLQFGKIGRAHV